MSVPSVPRPRLKPIVWDAVGASLLFWFCLGSTFGLVHTMPLRVFFAGAFCLPLVWRRTAPDAAAAALVVAHLVQLTQLDTPHPGNVSVPLIMYAVAAYGREEWAKRWLWAGLAASVVAGFAWGGPFRGALHGPFSPITGVFVMTMWIGLCSATVSAAWFMGSLRRARLARAQALVDRADALGREQVQVALLTATQERQRLARELHDIVAHSLSIIVVQADGARYVATEAPGDAEERLARAAQAIDTIASTARSALSETRRLVGVLHSAGEDAELAPAASLADIEALVGGVADAGRTASYTVAGDPHAHPPLGEVGELTAYRIVQEALTNVLKHAGPTASARVGIVHRPEGVSVTVSDDGRGATTTDGQGHGLIGMRERVHALGGTLVTGNAPGGGFEVYAFLPAQRGPA